MNKEEKEFIKEEGRKMAALMEKIYIMEYDAIMTDPKEFDGLAVRYGIEDE